MIGQQDRCEKCDFYRLMISREKTFCSDRFWISSRVGHYFLILFVACFGYPELHFVELDARAPWSQLQSPCTRSPRYFNGDPFVGSDHGASIDLHVGTLELRLQVDCRNTLKKTFLKFSNSIKGPLPIYSEIHTHLPNFCLMSGYVCFLRNKISRMRPQSSNILSLCGMPRPCWNANFGCPARPRSEQQNLEPSIKVVALNL